MSKQSPKQPSIIFKKKTELWVTRITLSLGSPKDQEKIIHGFISSRVDYCDGLLTALPKKTIKQLQFSQNAAARGPWEKRTLLQI